MPCAIVELYSEIFSAWTGIRSLSILIAREDAFLFLPRGVADDLSFGNVTKGSVLILLGDGERGVGGLGVGAGTEGVTE